jgi:chemotaxis methyl-accepting protein methylase
VDTLVVPTTSFFRHPEQFDALASLMPAWGDPVVVWSAGCSIGAEPYSLAMQLHETGRKGWRVVATDVSSASLARAASGLYEARELSGLSADRRLRHLEREGDRWRVNEELREQVTFVHHNLVNEGVPRPARAAAAVLCRNVLIYFRPEVQRLFLERMADQVGGMRVLFLGATESLYGVTERLRPVRIGAAYGYLTGAPTAPVAEPPPRRAAAPTPPAPRPKVAPPVGDAPANLAAGQAAMAEGRVAAAVAAFRRACYLDSADPVAHLHLGMALDAGGHGAEARRAFAAARSALLAAPTALVEAQLEGFGGEELLDLVERRLSRP